MYKKIILTTLIALSFQSMAQTPSLEMNKILEPSPEEQEKKYYKELNEKLNPKLINDEKAALVTEDECFKEAYEELKTYSVERIKNETNTKYRGYENQIKQLTEFTNKKARGMGCKRATLFYKRELYDNLRSFVKREAKNQERIENAIAQSNAADLNIYEEGKKRKEEKNYKNHPYKESWYDYEKGIYEIRLVENKDEKVREDIEKELAKMEYNPIRKCKFTLQRQPEIFSKEFDTEYFIYDYIFEDFIGLINAHVNKKVRGLLIETPLNQKILFSISPNEDYNDYIDKLERTGGSSISFLQVENIEDIKIVEKEKSYIWPFERINMKRQNNLRGTLLISFNYTKSEKYIQLDYSITGDFKNNYIKYLKDTNIDLYNNAIINGEDGNWYFDEEGPGSIRLRSFILNNKLIVYRSKCFGPEYYIGS